jgi:hypothetical protein
VRSNLMLGVAAVALSLGIAGALAATPTSNFQARNTVDAKSRLPAQTNSSAPGLSRITNSKNITAPKGFTALSAASSGPNVATHIASLRAAGLAMRFVSSERTAISSKAGLDALRQRTSRRSKGLAGLKRAAGLPKATAPAVRRMALAAAKAPPRDNAKLLSSLSAR